MMSTCTARLVAYLTPPSSLGGPRDRFAGDSAGGSPFSWSASSLGACLDLAASTSCAARSSLSRRKKSDAVKVSLPRWSLHRSSKLTTRSHASTSSARCLWNLANYAAAWRCGAHRGARQHTRSAPQACSHAATRACESAAARAHLQVGELHENGRTLRDVQRLGRGHLVVPIDYGAVAHDLLHWREHVRPPGAHGRWRGSVRLRKHVGDSVALVECVALAPATAERYGELRAHAGHGGTSPLPLAPTMARPRSPDNTPKPARSFPDTRLGWP